MKYLVTGGAGFIGSHIVEALFAQGSEVIILDNLSTGLQENVPSGARLVVGHAGDASLLNQLLPGCAGIFHLAAVSSVQASLDRPVGVHEDNLTATLALLEAARRHNVPRFVFSSSAAVYGDTQGKATKEDMKPNPLSHYAVQKLAGEYYCQVYAKVYGLETVCLRYFNIFGPRQRADSPYSGAIAKFLDAARAERAPTIFGDGSQTRDLCPRGQCRSGQYRRDDQAGDRRLRPRLQYRHGKFHLHPRSRRCYPQNFSQNTRAPISCRAIR